METALTLTGTSRADLAKGLVMAAALALQSLAKFTGSYPVESDVLLACVTINTPGHSVIP